MIHCPPAGRAQRGATLIEVLVALLVLSVGMLGIAGLTSASMRFSQGSWARATVASALGDLADRVRSNPAASATAYVQKTANYATQTDVAYTLPITTDCMAAGTTCTDPAVLAAFQLTQWRRAVQSNLPSSAVWIDGSRDLGYEATVMWFDKSFVGMDGKTLAHSATCPGTSPIAQRTCCPSGAAVPDGVRCVNMTILP